MWGFLLRWPTSSRHIKPLMRKALPCHSIIITSQVRSSKSIAQSSPGKHQPKWRAIYNITLFQPRSKHRINTFGPENIADISQRFWWWVAISLDPNKWQAISWVSDCSFFVYAALSLNALAYQWLHFRIQWNLSVTTTSIIICITCDLFSNVL